MKPSDADFEQFGDMPEITRWWLSEIRYCLTKYLEIQKQEAYQLIVSNRFLKDLVNNEPTFLQTESPFYWAMLVTHNGGWWHDEQLSLQNDDYEAQQRRPPPHAIG